MEKFICEAQDYKSCYDKALQTLEQNGYELLSNRIVMINHQNYYIRISVYNKVVGYEEDINFFGDKYLREITIPYYYANLVYFNATHQKRVYKY